MSANRPTDEIAISMIPQKIIDGDIVPSKSGGIDSNGNPIGYYTLGSREFPFRDLYIGPNTLYVNGTALVQGGGQAMNINVDEEQDLNIKTESGILNLTSTNSNVYINAKNDTGIISLNSQTISLDPFGKLRDSNDFPYTYSIIGFRENIQTSSINHCIPFLLNSPQTVTDDDTGVKTNFSYTGLEKSINFTYNGSVLNVSGGQIRAGSLNVDGDIDFGGQLMVGGEPFRSGSFQLDDNNNAVFNDTGNVGIKKTPDTTHSLDVSGRVHADSLHSSGYIGTNSQIEINVPFSSETTNCRITVTIDNPHSGNLVPQAMMVETNIMASDVNSQFSLLHSTDYMMGTTKAGMTTKAYDIHKRIESNIGITFGEITSAGNQLKYQLLVTNSTVNFECNGFLNLKISGSNAGSTVMTASSLVEYDV